VTSRRNISILPAHLLRADRENLKPPWQLIPVDAEQNHVEKKLCSIMWG